MGTLLLVFLCIGVSLAAPSKFSHSKQRRQTGGSIVNIPTTADRDILNNCDRMCGKDVCAHATYLLWAIDNCCLYCQYPSTSTGGTLINTGTISAGGTITIDGSVIGNGTMTAGGPISIGGSVTGNGTMTAGGPITIGGPVTGNVTMTAGGPITIGGTTTVGACADALPNCETYGKYICSSTEFAQWVSKNCAHFCNKCTVGSVIGGTMTGGAMTGGAMTGSTITGGTTTGDGSQSACVDALPNCQSYGQAVCASAEYAQWVSKNCAHFCNKCSGGTMTGNGTMTGTGTTIGNGTMAGTGTMTGNATTTGTSPMTGNSTNIGTGTMTGNGTMTETGTMTGNGTISGTGTMAGTGGSQTSGTVAGQTGSGMTGTGSGGTLTGGTVTGNGTMTGNGTVTGTGGIQTGGTMTGQMSTGMTGTAKGCLYNNQVYQQGQSWKDGCKFKCQCDDASVGKYQCEALCVTWQLPAQCTMNPPADGMCCQTPSCPDGVKIQYPPNYVPN